MLAALTVASMVWVCAGCTAHPEPEPTPASSVTAASDALRDEPTLVDGDGVPVEVTWVDTADAQPAVEGEQYTVDATISVPDECGAQLTTGALYDDGAWFVAQRPEENCAWQGEQWLPAPYQVGVLNPGDADPTLWDSTAVLVPGDHPRQVTTSAVTPDGAVWAETDSTNLTVDNWRVFAGDRATGHTHLVARSQELTGGSDLAYSEVTIAVDGSNGYWSSTPPDTGDGAAFVPVVVSKPLDGTGELATVATDADQPVATDVGVVVRTFTSVSTVPAAAAGSGAPEAQDTTWPSGLGLVTQTGVKQLLSLSSDSPLTPEQHVTALSASGPLVAFAVAGTAYLLDVVTGAVTGFRGAAGQGVEAASGSTDVVRESSTINDTALDGRVLSWTFGGGSASVTAPLFVYRLDDEVTWRVDIERSFGQTWVAGRYVAWRSLLDGTTRVTWLD
jgi:hypothetical protein